MKKVITMVLTSLLLVACSAEDEAPDIDGLYVYDDTHNAYYVRIEARKATAIIIEDETGQYILEGIRTKGSYPDYIYTADEFDDFSARFHFYEGGANAILNGSIFLKQSDSTFSLAIFFHNISANFQQVINQSN